VRVINIWNHETETYHTLQFKKRPKPTANPKMETVTALMKCKSNSYRQRLFVRTVD